MYQNFISYLYEAQHVSGDTLPIIRSLKLHWQPPVLHTWRVVRRVVDGQRPATTRPTTQHLCKTRGCQCSFRLLMMGGVSPETCWVSYKYEIKFWYTDASCWISVWIILWCNDPRTSNTKRFGGFIRLLLQVERGKGKTCSDGLNSVPSNDTG